MPEDNPFVAGANHGIGEGDLTLNVGVSGPGVVLSALRRLRESSRKVTLTDVAETIKRMSFKVTRAGELIGQKSRDDSAEKFALASSICRLPRRPRLVTASPKFSRNPGSGTDGLPWHDGSAGALDRCGEKGGAMATSSVGGLSGAFIPVSEDHDMVSAVRTGALSLDKLEAMTAVCSVGLDMVAVPGDTSAAMISAIIADEISIGTFNNKTTAVRIIPVPGKAPVSR